MSTYYLDTEFNSFNGELISLALVNKDETKPELYLARGVPDMPAYIHPWVKDNVLPILDVPGATPVWCSVRYFPKAIYEYLKRDGDVVIITDWPDDIKYFMESLITGPGMMIGLKGLELKLKRVDAYPTKLQGAVQHNALWDARALREYFK